ncbi:hypothetical protein [Mesorhizobium sanjuanii]|uniref:hypothetical protein n=1 Tax=Mesorhizobium sanjuanii TaxID=2037900 RepID=UPI001AD7F62C|nr:hypothetical protein [Mesorhizobium sanjuanii]
MLFINAPVSELLAYGQFPKVLPGTRRPSGFAAVEGELPGISPALRKNREKFATG